MAIEIEHQKDRADVGWFDPQAAASTARILQAVEAFGPDRTARDRARTVGMGRLFVLLIGIGMVLAVVVTLNQLITDALHGVAQGM